MPEYYSEHTPTVKARPFTFQELLTIPTLYKEDYEKNIKEYNDYADKAALIRSMAGESPTAQKAFAEYDNGVKGLSEAMLSGRWNPQMAAEAQNLREMYRNKIIPIGTAINNYQEDLKRFDALNKDGKAFGNTATLENYIQDPNYRGRFYSGSALQQEAMTAGALVANGITPQQLAEYYSNPSAPQFKGINDVVNRILAENGYNSLDDDAKKQMRGYVMNGLGMGLQASANKTYDEALKYQRDLNKILYNHRLSAANSSSGGGGGKSKKGITAVLDDKGNIAYYMDSSGYKTNENGERLSQNGLPIKVGKSGKGSGNDKKLHNWNGTLQFVANYIDYNDKDQQSFLKYMFNTNSNVNNKTIHKDNVVYYRLDNDMVKRLIGKKLYKDSGKRNAIVFTKKGGWSLNHDALKSKKLSYDDLKDKEVLLCFDPLLSNTFIVKVGDEQYFVKPFDININEDVLLRFGDVTRSHYRYLALSDEENAKSSYNDALYDKYENLFEQEMQSLSSVFNQQKSNTESSTKALIADDEDVEDETEANNSYLWLEE